MSEGYTPFYEVWEDCLRMAEEILGEAARRAEEDRRPRESLAAVLCRGDLDRLLLLATECASIVTERDPFSREFLIVFTWADGDVYVHRCTEVALEVDTPEARLRRIVDAAREHRAGTENLWGGIALTDPEAV